MTMVMMTMVMTMMVMTTTMTTMAMTIMTANPRTVLTTTPPVDDPMDAGGAGAKCLDADVLVVAVAPVAAALVAVAPAVDRRHAVVVRHLAGAAAEVNPLAAAAVAEV